MSKESKILVVDDDKEVANVLVKWLEKKGYPALATYGGPEGIAAFKKGGYDLVITDLVMGEMDGMELLQTVKALDPQVVVLMITGFGSTDMAVMAIQEGAYDFIAKPVDFTFLDVIVNRALERHSLSRRLSISRRLTAALGISIPFWLILGAVLANIMN